MKAYVIKNVNLMAMALVIFGGMNLFAQMEVRKPFQEVPLPKSIVRKSFGFDYNSWYQTLLIKNATASYESQGLLYGLGISYHHSVYYAKWGWGGEAGYIQGYGVTGNSSSTTEYYAKRVPLSIWRLGGRLFRRMNSNIDIGAATNILIGAQSWPSDKGYSVDAKIDQVIGVFIDSRWRLVRQWEISQALGTYAKSKSIAWRLGATYSF